MNETATAILPNMSPRTAARVAGTGYILVFILGVITNFFIFNKLIVPGEMNTSAENVISHQTIFRLGIVSWIVVLVFDSVVAWALYIFLSPVDKNLALLCAWFRLIYVAIFGASLVNLFSVLHVLTDPGFLTTVSASQAHAQAMLFLNNYSLGFDTGILFFAIHVLLLGYLIMKSGNIPSILGILLLIAGLAYVANSFGSVTAAGFTQNPNFLVWVVAVPAIAAELSFTVWLLAKGGKEKAAG